MHHRVSLLPYGLAYNPGSWRTRRSATVLGKIFALLSGISTWQQQILKWPSPAVVLLEAVQGQLQSDQILGWFAYRPVTSLQPTAQECIISSSMVAALDSLQVHLQTSQTLFAIISSLPRHEGSSCEFQQRMFQVNSNRYVPLAVATDALHDLTLL